jgi:probable phosphoglycerate mutase
MSSGRLLLIRHGESVANVRGFAGCHGTCEGLTDRGRHQAELLAERLDAVPEFGDDARVLASALPRAIETARIATRGRFAIDQRCELCELHAGEADGLTFGEISERFGFTRGMLAEPDRPLAPGGESWNGFIKRAGDALELVVDEHREGTTVVFTHNGVLAASFAAFAHATADRPISAPAPWTSITEWSWRDDGPPRLARYADAAHLSVDLRVAAP